MNIYKGFTGILRAREFGMAMGGEPRNGAGKKSVKLFPQGFNRAFIAVAGHDRWFALNIGKLDADFAGQNRSGAAGFDLKTTEIAHIQSLHFFHRLMGLESFAFLLSRVKRKKQEPIPLQPILQP